MSLDPNQKVPARYVGAHRVILPAANGPYEDAQGRRRESAILAPGDTLKVYPQEAWGQTYKWDPSNVAPLLFLGYGRVLLAEHANPVVVVNEETGETAPRKPYTTAELEAMGYEFQPAETTRWESLVPPPDPDAEALAALGLSAVQTAGISVAPPSVEPAASAPARAPRAPRASDAAPVESPAPAAEAPSA